MIVRQFLQWVQTAPAGERAEATSALARAYLYSDLTPDDRAAAEGAMIMLLDDPSPLVRRALAEALAWSGKAPPPVIHALAADQPEIAAIVLATSPLFIDADLVDLVATGTAAVQTAIARRVPLQCAAAAAIAEVGCAEACLILIENAGAEIAGLSIDRVVARFGHVAAIREALFVRDDLAPATRQAVLSVRPGITDLASIEYRDENALLAASTDPERTYVEQVLPAKLALCERYIRERSFLGDLRIIGRSMSVSFTPH